MDNTLFILRLLDMRKIIIVCVHNKANLNEEDTFEIYV
jgi:hypothetical protein